MTTTTPRRVDFAEYAAQLVNSPFGRAIESQSPASSSTTSPLSSINSQLLTHGWAKRPINLDALSQRDRNEVVGVLYELLGAGVTSLLTLDNLSSRHRTLTYEHERLTRTHAQVRIVRARLEAAVEGWKARCADAEKRLSAEEAKTKELREEVGRGRKAMDGVRIAAGHESKKIQSKLDKAHAQLGRLANDATLASRPQGLMLLNPIMGGRTQSVTPGQSPLLEQSLKDLAEIRESLQEETEAFRHVVVSTGNGLREALALAAGEEVPPRLPHSQFFAHPATNNRCLSHSVTQTQQASSSTTHPSIADTRLKSLIAAVQKRLMDRTPPKPLSGPLTAPLSFEDEEERKRSEREQEKSRRDLEDRVKDLEVEVTCAMAREEEAKKLVEELARLQVETTSSCAPAETGGQNPDEEDVLEFGKEKALLDEERRKFTEAALRLGQERRQLEASGGQSSVLIADSSMQVEREAFLEEQRKADADALRALLPLTAVTDNPIPEIYSDPSSPYASTSSWGAHRPISPSPLSPSHLKSRIPKHHSARRRSAKTPLSRLVLEKAVRQKGREIATVQEQERLGVLGDGSRRANTSKPDALKSSTKTRGTLKDGVVSLAASTGPGANRDLSKSEGIGPRGAARGSKAWR